MDQLSMRVRKEFCGECAMALRRFIGHMDGVEEGGVESGRLVIRFDSGKIGEAELFRISKESVENLGYEVQETELFD